jgi:hypothetical protein
MQGGDIIFIGDSVSKSIIAKGYLTCKPGTRAYRYNSHDPVREQENLHAPWRHEVAVAWDDDFVPFGYKDGAPQHTVMRFDPTWTCASLGGTEDEGEAAFLTETAYLRKTRASEKNVLRLHAALSNRFRAWLKRRFQVTAIQEENHEDIHFIDRGTSYVAELKTCYGGNTKAALREALGQIIEYNHYPPRLQKERWLLVLDSRPTATDQDYITAIRTKYHLPIGIAWPLNAEFEIAPLGFLGPNA